MSYLMAEGQGSGTPDILARSSTHAVTRLPFDKALLETSDGSDPDAYVIDAGQDGDVLDMLLPELRVRSHSRHAPVLVLYPPRTRQTSLSRP